MIMFLVRRIPVPKKSGVPYKGLILTSCVTGVSIGVIGEVLTHWDWYMHPERIHVPTGLDESALEKVK
ncbi:hypothetical protein ACF0H5_011280 [Mactra antiquata]